MKKDVFSYWKSKTLQPAILISPSGYPFGSESPHVFEVSYPSSNASKSRMNFISRPCMEDLKKTKLDVFLIFIDKCRSCVLNLTS